MDTKAAFESEIKSRGMSAMKRDGRYVDSATRFAFDFWQASRAAIEIELKDAYLDADKGKIVLSLTSVINEMESHGIRIKGKTE